MEASLATCAAHLPAQVPARQAQAASFGLQRQMPWIFAMAAPSSAARTRHMVSATRFSSCRRRLGMGDPNRGQPDAEHDVQLGVGGDRLRP